MKRRLFQSALLSTLLMSSAAHAQLIVAHRGASYDAPENTLAAFRLAWEQGADAVEGDFYLTTDGEIACFHDKDGKRVTGKSFKITEASMTDLRKLEAGAWKHKKYKGEPIPTLAQVLAIVPEGKKILIEIKCGPEIVPALKAELAKSSLKPEQTEVICFNEDVVAAVKRDIPGIKAHWLTSFKQDKKTGAWSPSIESILDTLKKTNADGLDCKAELAALSPQFVKALRDAGMEFHCWTVNDPKQAKAMQKLGVDSITTDRPAFLRRSLK